jgi:hypothetical protein
MNSSTKRFLFTGAFVVLVVLSLGLGSVVSVADQTYPLQSSVAWSLVWVTTPSNSHFDMTVAAFASNASVIPNHVAVSYWLTYDGSKYYNHGCSLNYANGRTYDSCSFTVPFKGDGEYVFYATFKDNKGNVVSQSIVDPFIKSGR